MSDLLLRDAYLAHQAGNAAEAMRLCQDILRATPQNFAALNLLGYLYSQSRRFAEAERLLGEAVKINPSSDVIYNRGCALQNLGRYEEALACFQRAAAANPDFVDALVNCGYVQLGLRRFQDALASFDKALARKPADAQILNNRGHALLELGREMEALASFDKAIALDPNYVSAWSNRGVALQRLKRTDESLASLERALAIDPRVAAVHNNLGNSYMALRRYDEAAAEFEHATALDPNFVESLINRATVLVALRRMDEALALYDRALSLRPDNPEALRNRANALVIQKRFEEAARDCERLLRLDPDFKYMKGILAHNRLQCCDWRGFTEMRMEIESGLRAGRRVIPPFEYLALCRNAADQHACARIFARDKFPAQPPLWRGERYRHDRIRIAYLSADFRNHAVASLMAGVFEHHDKSRFETIAFSFGVEKTGPMRARLEAAFEHFIDVERSSDQEIAKRLRQMEVDIAVDLMGHTGESRPGVLSFRAAPVQVLYLGYAGTMGTDFLDYIIADRIVIPEQDHRYYSEKVVSLPGAYLTYDSRRTIAQAPGRAESGLPEKGFVFCSFNNAYKFSPEMFGVWMRLLHAVPGSVLWLPQGNAAAMRNLASEAAVRGVAADRIRFAPYVTEGDKHLARMGLADLFLDTLPYNAHTTAIDALWAGLPLLTCKGESFAGRVAASLLSAAGLPEMITDSLAAYEARALALARNPAALAEIRAKLAKCRSASPLFDTLRFTRKLEAAYIAMWERQQRGESPASFALAQAASMPP
jgi:predicted O-linked N-acetylglucosamine transferase (SPINDLY family)